MVKKRVDPRVQGLVEQGVARGHRSLFVLVGDHGKDQVENLHRLLSKSRIQARPSVLWCYKKELGFSTHKKKRMREIKRNQARGLHDPDIEDPFDLFISSTNIRWTYYKETEKILGQTFGMCVLQDFEALTPNILARTIETVEGGGIIVLLIKTVKSLKQLYTMTMDVHGRFRTESHFEVIPRFNERFILSLAHCKNCLVLDDELNILPICKSALEDIPAASGSAFGQHYEGAQRDSSGTLLKEDPAFAQIRADLSDAPKALALIDLAKTVDQAKSLMSFLDAISDCGQKSLNRSVVSLTAARGRGKSASLGLCLAGAVSFGLSNIFVTAPSPENLKTVFEFIVLGLKSLKYSEHIDFEVIQEKFGEIGKVAVRINIFKDHRQTIQYILPTESSKLSQAELVAVDEAAAIPLPVIKRLMGPYLVFLSSTINGYEGTGRALSLKLIQQLRSNQANSITNNAHSTALSLSGPKNKKGERKIHEERWKAAATYMSSQSSNSTSKVLTEISLNTPIRYAENDPIEKWLNDLLCLDVNSNSTRIVSSIPAPKDCDLYLVDRDALFSFHELSETLLQRIWALYTAAHYKNAPNDLQMLSDAPAHRLFVLLGPQKFQSSGKLPDILCVVQVAFEGMISQKSVQSELAKGNKASGDLIPWTISQQFNDSEFATLSGARIVRIATHPDVQKMGYGSRAIDLLVSYFQGELTIDTISAFSGVYGKEGLGIQESSQIDHNDSNLLSEEIKPRSKLPPLLTPIYDRPAERLHWLGVSFGLTTQLLNFWSRKGFKVCYLRQTCNELTGEYSSIVLKELDCNNIKDEEGTPLSGWLASFVDDYKNRLISLMSYSFSSLESPLALNIIDSERILSVSNSANDVNEEEAPSNPLNALSAEELINYYITFHDLKRLEMYSKNMVDHHMILDIVPTLAKLFFQKKLGNIRFSFLQLAILIAIGMQHRDVDSISKELDLPVNQILAFFNKTIRKISSYLRKLMEAHAAQELPSEEKINILEKRVLKMKALRETLSEDQERDQKDFTIKQEQKSLLMENKDLTSHEISANITDLKSALLSGINVQKNVPSSISIAKVTSDTTNGEENSKKRLIHDAQSPKKKKSKKKSKQN